MIGQLFKQRLNIYGITQSCLANMTGCTPTQMGFFLKEKGFVNKNTLEKCFEILGIDIEIYGRRYKLAEEASAALSAVPADKIRMMTKHEMAKKSKQPAIESLLDVDEKQFEDIIRYGVVDYESTFVYFKALVLHLKNINGKFTPKSVEKSFTSLLAPIQTGMAALVPMGLIMFTGAALITSITKAFLDSSEIHTNIRKSANPLISIAKSFTKL